MFIKSEIENIKSADVADGWLSLDFHGDTQMYHLKLEYHDGEELELKVYKNYTRALKKFYDEAEKLQ